MDILFIIALTVAVLVLLTNPFRPTPQPQIIYVRTEMPEQRSDGLGCLLWIAGAFLLLLILGTVQIGG